MPSVNVPLDPFSLNNFLRAGTLSIAILADEPCYERRRAADDWYILHDTRKLRDYVHAQGHTLLDSLSFLVEHRFISATYKILRGRGQLLFRVYLIPHDLPGVLGALQNRDESSILKPGRNKLRFVLRYVSRDAGRWEGKENLEGGIGAPFLPYSQDDRTLGEIFGDLTLTSSSTFVLPEIPELRTQLYSYQRESVAEMLEREECVDLIDDPLYVRVTGLEGKTFYLQPKTMKLLHECPRLSPNKGGFLCEELGSGKTVMTLALILATLDTLPKPPDHVCEESSILTPLAIRHFPQEPFISACLPISKKISRHDRRFPSLVELLSHYVRASPTKVEMRYYEDELTERHLWKPLSINTPFYLHREPSYTIHGARRYRTAPQPRVIYLSSATLIVVPRTLSAQWNSEILKHCTSAIRTLVIKQKTQIPSARRLASNYDIVIIKDTRVTSEAKMADLSALNTGYMCHCQSFPGIRIPNCTCGPLDGVSPLLQIRWKRLIRDEGHNAVSLSTQLNSFLNMISAERRWIVTGTPTVNLLGLGLGKSSELVTGECMPGFVRDTSILIPLTRPRNVSAVQLGTRDNDMDGEDGDALGELQYPPHIWSSNDRGDLHKLGVMMGSFLGVSRFAAEPGVFDRLVVDPLCGRNGPLPGAVQVLTQVMSSYMIRHRVEDIEREVKLPPLNEETVLLGLDPYAQLTYNVLLSLIVVNAVDSERRDQDYLFHPSKTASLNLTVENLSHALFWRVDEDQFDEGLPDTLHHALNAIGHARERNQPEEDIKLVQKAVRHIHNALNDHVFRDLQHGLEVPYRVSHVPARLQCAWGICPDVRASEPACFMYPSYAIELRRAVERQPLVTEKRLSELAEAMREKDKRLAEVLDLRKAGVKASPKKGGKRKMKEDAEVGKAAMSQMQRTVGAKEKFEEAQKELAIALKKLSEMGGHGDGKHNDRPSVTMSPPDAPQGQTPGGSALRSKFLRLSPLSRASVGLTTSSKLNFILSEVCKYAATEKFLIFSRQPFNLVHIAEGLELLGVKFLLFMSEAEADKRDQGLTTFETSDTYRVFLMELRHGARGLNIVSASRVIFCEPVWHADVESQAIKRVHRIGQTRPVTVKTLAIRSTFEEYMIQRRKEFKGASDKPPGMIEEMGIRDYLQNPAFLESPPRSDVNLEVPLLLFPEDDDVLSAAERENVVVSDDGPLAELRVTTNGDACGAPIDRVIAGDGATIVMPPPKRKKVVHFQ